MLGPLIAVGRTSKVFQYGNDAVAKVLNANVPDHWAGVEAELTESVRALGVPAPHVLDVITVDGRPTVLLEYIEGPSMWSVMANDRGAVAGLMRDFVEMQRLVHTAGVPDRLPGLVSRLSGKIAEVDAVDDEQRRLAIEMTNGLPRGAALLHGDFHPGNVLLSASGPILIDWFDASVGHPVAGVVRTELLIDAACAIDRRHLVGATDDDLVVLSEAYALEMADTFDAFADRLDEWRAVTALSRISERTDDDVATLVARWAEFRDRALGRAA